ncbi:MAG: 5-oxoprolinase subunit PxpB [Pyrinomonadaceae bacterium]|nr:5-oxoprolinase subunit PxpB [Pyrinomonadaceae bacterium]
MRHYPVGECGLTVEFGKAIDPQLNQRALAVSEKVRTAGFEWLIDCVPSYASVTVFFDLIQIQNLTYTSAQDTVLKAVIDIVRETSNDPAENTSTFDVPVRFGGDHGPDMETVCEHNGLTETEAVELFLSREYRVYLLGFLPGFAYMGTLDRRVATPRLNNPRQVVKAGSVGIAGRQTGIYPLDSPGGWRIIGRTELPLFTPHEEKPVLFSPGDKVRFSAV